LWGVRKWKRGGHERLVGVALGAGGWGGLPRVPLPLGPPAPPARAALPRPLPPPPPPRPALPIAGHTFPSSGRARLPARWSPSSPRVRALRLAFLPALPATRSASGRALPASGRASRVVQGLAWSGRVAWSGRAQVFAGRASRVFRQSRSLTRSTLLPGWLSQFDQHCCRFPIIWNYAPIALWAWRAATARRRAGR